MKAFFKELGHPLGDENPICPASFSIADIPTVSAADDIAPHLEQAVWHPLSP
jgi:hypothetical protein